MYKRRYSTTALKRKMLFGGIAILILAAILVGAFFLFRAVLGLEPKIYDESALPGAPDIKEGKNGYLLIQNPDVCTLSLCTKPVADESRQRVGIYLTNPADSPSAVRVEAYLVNFFVNDKGALDYSPGDKIGGTYFVKPGEHVVYMDLDRIIKVSDLNGDQLPVLLKISARNEADGTSDGTFFIQGAFYLEESSAN